MKSKNAERRSDSLQNIPEIKCASRKEVIRNDTNQPIQDTLPGMVEPSRPSADGRRYRDKCLGGSR